MKNIFKAIKQAYHRKVGGSNDYSKIFNQLDDLRKEAMAFNQEIHKVEQEIYGRKQGLIDWEPSSDQLIEKNVSKNVLRYQQLSHSFVTKQTHLEHEMNRMNKEITGNKSLSSKEKDTLNVMLRGIKGYAEEKVTMPNKDIVDRASKVIISINNGIDDHYRHAKQENAVEKRRLSGDFPDLPPPPAPNK